MNASDAARVIGEEGTLETERRHRERKERDPALLSRRDWATSASIAPEVEGQA